MLQTVRNLLRDNKGIAALEYALIAGIVFAALIGMGTIFAGKLSSAFSNLGQSVLSRDAGT